MGRTNVAAEETEATYANAGTNTGHAGLGDNSKMDSTPDLRYRSFQ